MTRAVLVTGAGSGIGLATALEVARLGFVTHASVRSDDGEQRLRHAADRAEVELDVVRLDVTDVEGCERVVGGLDLYGLVNNAGSFNAGAVEDVTDEEAFEQLHAMVVAPMRLARLALPGMRAHGQGRIVNVTSAITLLSGAMTGWYQASKSALTAVSDALRMEVAEDGVEVVRIEPGGIDTGIWGRAEQDLLRRRDGTSHPGAYARALRILRAFQGEMAEPHRVATVIGEALTAGRPKVCYRVGADAPALALAHHLLPARARDRLVRTALDL
jgi:NAD(P)-dependent dehydrogenase (short-subunit alcohol dehydrogenase family)